MACPWFQPESVLSLPDAILPLGKPWAGACRAPGGSGAAPQQGGWAERCNLGYARGRCPAFPAGDGPDAVRFAITGHADNLVSICCSREKDYLPFDRETLVYSTAERRFLAACADPLAQSQARAYLESYLCQRKKTA